MKKLVLLLIALLVLTGCESNKKDYIPGTYIGIAEGYLNTVEVSVTVDEHYILEIELIRSDDPEILMTAVMEELPRKIIKQNGTDVESVSGATYTSESLLEAIEAALEQAENKE